MRLAFLLVVAALIPVAAQAQQPGDSSVRGDTGLEYRSHPDDNIDQYRTGARFSDLLVVRGQRVGLRVSPAVGPLSLTGRLRFRGPQTILDDRLPLVILDGMRLDAASGLLGGTLRLEEINPEDIESVEVLSPAQGVRYGPGAANGVLIVQTHSGHRGSPQWRGYAEVGTRTPSEHSPGLVGGFDADNPDSLLRNGGCTLLAAAAGSCAQDSIVALASPLNQQLRTAVRRQYGLSVTGGWNRVSYYVAGEFDGDGGPFSLSRDEITRLQSGGQVVSRSIRYPERVGRASLSANIHVQPVPTITIGLRGLHVSGDTRAPAFLNDLSTGAALYDLQTGYLAPGDAFQVQTVSEVTRWLGNVDVAWAPTRALTITGNLGHDGGRSRSGRQGGPGVLTESVVFNSRTFGLGADYAWGFPGVRLMSHAGFDRSSIGRDSLECASGTSPNCTSGAYRTYEERYWQRYWSIVLEQRAVINDALELVGTIRRDQFRFWNAKPVHAALHASWWRGAWHLHADYGSAGRRIFLFAKPERTREISTGFDVSTLSGRLSVGGNIYDMRSSVFAPIGASYSSGYGIQVFPATIGNRGIELNATAQLIERRDVMLKVEATAWGNRNRLLSMSPFSLAIPGGAQQISMVGYPVGGFWAWRPPAYADANGNRIIERNEISGPVDVVWAGTPYPTQGATLAPELRLRAIRMGGSLDYQAGHVVFNRNHWFSCFAGSCPWAVDPATPFAEQADVAYGRPTPRYFENGDFLALRELWITADAPPEIARALHVKSSSITLAGRNLHTWTGYTGISPEPYAAETQFGDPEAFTEPLMPALPQWSLRVRISY
jgi:outer membrane receptor protein involved in Fe transport